jgi:hypothetical protein
MQLLHIPQAKGAPDMWINADHLVSVARLQRRGPDGLEVAAELKIEGLQLLRVPVGTYLEPEDADAAWSTFLEGLQSER